MTQNTYNPNEIYSWCNKILLHYGFKIKDAKIITQILLEADLRGIFSHGVAGGSGLDDIIQKVQKGGINTDYKLNMPLQKERKYPTIVNIDADGGPGHSISKYCVDMVKKIARKYGSGKIYLYNSTHFGAAGIYSEMIAEDKDLIGKVTCITPGWMTPYSKYKDTGKVKRIGTNPIAWSTPYEQGIVTIDMATSQRAASVALNAGKSNQDKKAFSDMKAIDPDYLIDVEGNEVIYPQSTEHVKNSSILPLGGINYGYKGYGLSVAIELEHIAGGCENTNIKAGCKTLDGRVGQVFEAVSIDSALEKAVVLSKISSAVSDILSCGGDGTKLPGQIEMEARERYLREGIPYSDSQIDRLIKIGSCTGIELNLKNILF